VHLPVFSLLACAVGGLMRFECLWMDGFYGKISDNVLNFTGFDVILFDLGQRRTDVPGTKGSLVV
jgi:hypothetical protein